jgi:hypothetical protein
VLKPIEREPKSPQRELKAPERDFHDRDGHGFDR